MSHPILAKSRLPGHSWSLQRKVAAGAILTVGLCTLAGSLVFFLSLQRVTEDDIDAIVLNSTATATAIKEDLEQRIVGYVSILSRRQPIAAAVAQGDLGALEDSLMLEYQALKDLDPSVAAVEAVDSTGVVLMRGHNPTRKGGDLSEDPLVRIALSGRTAHGLRVSPDTRSMGIHVAAPLFSQQEIVGALRIATRTGVETAHFVKQKTGAEVVFFIAGKVIASTLDDAACQALSKTGHLAASRAGSAPAIARERIAGESYQVCFTPLLDTSTGSQATMAVYVSRQHIERAKIWFMLWYLVAVGSIMICIAWVAVIAARRMTQPLSALTALATEMAEGDLREKQTVSDADDEIGRSARSIGKSLNQMGGVFRAIVEHSRELSSSSEVLTAISQQMRAGVELTSEKARKVSAGADEVSHNIQTVAGAAEEMNANVLEIANSVREAEDVAGRAVKLAGATTTTISKLDQGSTAIAEVASVITSIARQTNLLALNATIEAARAGESGRGFGVVAQEVKELAKQTAQATEDISATIATIQTETHDAVAVIGEISQIIVQISATQSLIAAAIKEQSATTAEIGRRVSDVARGSTEIADNITDVAQAAQSTTEGAANTLSAARDLARMAAQLEALMAQFKY